MTSPSVPRALLDRLLSEHVCAPGATEAEVDAAELRLDCELPLPLLEVLRATNGADLWKNGDFPCRLLSTTELAPPSEFVYRSGPEGLLAVLTLDGAEDCLAVQTDRFSPHFGKVVDCFHETFPDEIRGICDSIAEMLRLALESNGREWIWPAVRNYGRDYALR